MPGPLGQPSVFIVVGLQFGDEGKGATVDYLARRFEAGLVVRFNGGAQAGHNVVVRRPSLNEMITLEETHTFSSFGSGTFAGCGTHLTRHVLVDPVAMRREAEVLLSTFGLDAMERLTISPHSPVVTPLHKVVNRIRELQRPDAHGTCGMGIGEAQEEADAGHALRAGLLKHPDLVREWLKGHRQRMGQRLATIVERIKLPPRVEEQHQLMLSPEAEEQFVQACEHLAYYDPCGRKPDSHGRPIIFEGAQGVLLDQDHGFHPHTTWSRTTFANADQAIREGEIKHIDLPIPSRFIRVGVARAYITRHGEGPLPSHVQGMHFPDEHNHVGTWQGAFRVGAPDLPMLRRAHLATGDIDWLVVTHCDHLSQFKARVVAYDTGKGGVQAIPPLSAHACARATPVWQPMPEDGFTHLDDMRRLMGAERLVEGWGPTAVNYHCTEGLP